MKIVGLTGTVGCGKSTVGKLIQDNFSAKLFMTDEIGHLVMKKGSLGYEEVVNLFGAEILNQQGEIDRKILGGIVFGDEEKLKQLNEIIHPKVKKYLEEDIAREIQNKKYLFYVIESAILIETGLNEICQECWYVDTPDDIRRKRLKESRGYSDEKIEAILSNQKGKDYFIKYCDHTIENKNLEDVLLQIEKLLVLK